MEPDRTEVALDDDQVAAPLDPVQVEQLFFLREALGELVLVLPLGKLLEVADPAACIGDELALDVADRDGDPPRHAALRAEAEAEELDEGRGDTPLGEVGVRRIEREGKAERLVALCLAVLLIRRLRPLRSPRSSVCPLRGSFLRLGA